MIDNASERNDGIGAEVSFNVGSTDFYIVYISTNILDTQL